MCIKLVSKYFNAHITRICVPCELSIK